VIICFIFGLCGILFLLIKYVMICFIFGLCGILLLLIKYVMICFIFGLIQFTVVRIGMPRGAWTESASAIPSASCVMYIDGTNNEMEVEIVKQRYDTRCFYMINSNLYYITPKQQIKTTNKTNKQTNRTIKKRTRRKSSTSRKSLTHFIT
jgi:hypothetical protein